MEPADTRTAAAEVGRKSTPGEPIVSLDGAREVARRLRARLQAAVIGRDEVVELMIVSLLADGHVLLEDYPGSGKTTLAKALGDAIIDDLPEDDIPSFRRVQFTPDLLPSDVTGVSVFDAGTSRFLFRRGPIFAYVVLADEINRTSPKVQSAMLEAMAEKQVTVDNITHKLDELFFVIATQNPLDLAGTYPLPVAQLDRFLFKIRMEHISRDAELEVLATWQERMAGAPSDLLPVTRTQVLGARRITQKTVVLAPPIRECLVDVARSLRDDKRVLQGASTRSLVLALPALQARAVLHGRDFASAEDIAALAPRIFGHRIELAPGFDDTDVVIRECASAPLERLARASMSRG